MFPNKTAAVIPRASFCPYLNWNLVTWVLWTLAPPQHCHRTRGSSPSYCPIPPLNPTEKLLSTAAAERQAATSEGHTDLRRGATPHRSHAGGPDNPFPRRSSHAPAPKDRAFLLGTGTRASASRGRAKPNKLVFLNISMRPARPRAPLCPYLHLAGEIPLPAKRLLQPFFFPFPFPSVFIYSLPRYSQQRGEEAIR